MINRVDITKGAAKDLAKLPTYIARKFRLWVATVEEVGVDEVRKNQGWHDEPLRGARTGQRSVRLSRGYRAFYVIDENDMSVEFILVEEVNKHDY